MAQPYSKETLELLERARRAIDESIRLREYSQRAIRQAEMWQFNLELRLSRERVAASGRTAPIIDTSAIAPAHSAMASSSSSRPHQRRPMAQGHSSEHSSS
jgi:hypothetical protein